MSSGRIQFAEQNGVCVFKFSGEVRLTLSAALDEAIKQLQSREDIGSIAIDLSEACSIDSTTLGLLAKLSILAKEKTHLLPTLVSTQADINRVLQSMGFEQVFNLIEKPLAPPVQLHDLPPLTQSEEQARIRVLEAHRILMQLNESNRAAFADLVETLGSVPASNTTAPEPDFSRSKARGAQFGDSK